MTAKGRPLDRTAVLRSEDGSHRYMYLNAWSLLGRTTTWEGSRDMALLCVAEWETLSLRTSAMLIALFAQSLFAAVDQDLSSQGLLQHTSACRCHVACLDVRGLTLRNYKQDPSQMLF